MYCKYAAAGEVFILPFVYFNIPHRVHGMMIHDGGSLCVCLIPAHEFFGGGGHQLGYFFMGGLGRVPEGADAITACCTVEQSV